MLLAGRWWKFAYKQIHDNSRTKAQSAKAYKKWFLRFLLNKNLWNLREVREKRKEKRRTKKKKRKVPKEKNK